MFLGLFEMVSKGWDINRNIRSIKLRLKMESYKKYVGGLRKKYTNKVRIHPPKALLKLVTGQELNADYLISYLKKSIMPKNDGK